jgi:hypothetical protein
MNTFEKDNYVVIKNAISEEIASFVCEYFNMKMKVTAKMFESKMISPFEENYGVFDDGQVPGAFSSYADIAMEVLLNALHPLMEKQTGLQLVPNYSYARVYFKGQELPRHKDRFACEISTTLNLGGHAWPIFLEPDETKGTDDGTKYISENTKGVKVDLSPGDMLIYKGNLLEHWRDPLEGDRCTQVFLHYNRADQNESPFDGREFLGLPSCFILGKK